MEEYLDAFQKTQSMEGIAMALGYLTHMAAVMGDYKTAARYAEEGSFICQATGLVGNDAYPVSHDVAYIDYLRGNLVEARQNVEKTLKGAQDTNNKFFQARSLLLLGNVACYDGHPGEGQVLLEESLTMSEELKLTWLESDILLGLGHAACRQGDHRRAAVLYKQSLEKRREVVPGLPGRLEKFANLALHVHEPLRAARLLGAAENLRQRMGAPIPPVEQGEYNESLRLLCSQLDDKGKNEAWRSGAAMALNEIVAYVLEDLDEYGWDGERQGSW